MKKNRLATKAKPFGLEFLTAEGAEKVNGGIVFGLIVNPNPNPAPPPSKHHHHHKKPIFGLMTNPSSGSG
jgi:hypothetical protein